MALTFEEISVYLRCGDGLGDDLKRRVAELSAEAPIKGRGIFLRDGDVFFLCGTIGSSFDRWHRQLSVKSAADALIVQAIGTAAVEKVMDGLEDEIRSTLSQDEKLKPRRSPGYGKMNIGLNREIIERLDAAKRIGVSFTDSMTLLPSKSVTAVCEVEK